MNDIFLIAQDTTTKFQGFGTIGYGLAAIGSAIGVGTVSYTHLTLPTILRSCRSRWSPYH